MKLEKDVKFGFYICPECGLPLRYCRDPTQYRCDIIWECGLEGCGFRINKMRVEQ